MILMQTVPPHIDPKKIESELIKLAKDEYEVIAGLSFMCSLLISITIQTTINIHHLHVWTLSGDKIVGTVHIKLVDVGLDKFNKVTILRLCRFEISYRNLSNVILIEKKIIRK